MTTKIDGTLGVDLIKDGTVKAADFDPSLFLASKTADGYQKLPSGLIIQWGYVGIPVGGGLVVTYPIPFPNAVMACAATPFVFSGQEATITIVAQDLSTVLFNGYIAGALSAMSVQWIAIGY